ncbi:MAG: PAS domain S-box protein [Fischerella sp. CENA71]|nr:PAS domain S-box protein [Fischerella sp. CENA71]
MKESEQLLENILDSLPVNTAFLQVMFEHSAVGIVIIDLDGRFVKINSATQQMLGYTEQALQGMEFIDLIDESDRTINQVMFAQLLQQEREVFQTESRYRCKNGNYIYVRNTISLIFAQNGQAVLAIAVMEKTSNCQEVELEQERLAKISDNNSKFADLATLEDIEQGKKALEQLRESEERLRLILDLNDIGSWDWQIATGETTWNENHFRLLGLTPYATASNYQLWRDHVHPEDIDRVEQAIWDALNTYSDHKSEFRVIHPDGSLHWMMARGRGIYDTQGKPVRMIGVILNISDRKKTEEALKASESKLNAVLDSVNVAIVSCRLFSDKTVQYDYCSPGCEKIFGYTPAEFIADTKLWISLILDEDRENKLPAIFQDIYAERPTTLEYRFWHKDGSLRWNSESIISRRDDAADCWLATTVVVDITDRKRTEEELRQQKEFLQTIFDHIPVMLSLFDCNGQIQLVNREIERILGWSEEKIKEKGNSLLTESYPDSEYHHQVCNYILTASGKWQDFKTRTADGKIVDTCWANVRLSDGSIIGIGQDISDRKRAEEELRQFSTALEIRVQERTQELRESEERFRGAFDNAFNGMALVKPDGHLLKVNRAFCEILGYSEQELLEENFLLDNITHPEDLESHVNARQQILAGKISRIQIEKRYFHKLGDTIWVIYSSSLVRDSQSQPLYLVIQIQDITERRAIEKMKNEFISVVSHELRTPLSSIRGSLGLLAAGVLDKEPETTKQMLEIAASESERLVRLVNDILDLERLEANKIRLNQKWCDAANLIRQAIETLRPLAEENQITISLVSSGIQIWADEDWIIQTLVNLLINAIKFSHSGTTIIISAEDKAERVLFQVKDQGRGIPTDKLESIFGRFQQVDASDARQKGGTGLGLAICRKIIQQHGGRIWVESTLGKGSTFYFTLPTPIE